MNNIDFETDVTIEQLTIKPEDAREMLTRNTMNRNIDWKRVEKYAFDMKSGAWNMNGSTIVFAKDGTLLDGQKRLHAVIKANVAVEFLVVRNVDKDCVDTLDTGMARTSRHIMQIARSAHSNTAARLTKLLWLHDLMDSDLAPETCQSYVSNACLLNFYDQNKDLIEQAASIAECGGHHFVKSHMALAYCIIKRKTAYRYKLDKFFETVKTGASISEKHPIMTLRARLFDNKFKVRKLSVQETLAAYIRVWNAYVRDKDLTVIRWNASEPMPEVL